VGANQDQQSQLVADSDICARSIAVGGLVGFVVGTAASAAAVGVWTALLGALAVVAALAVGVAIWAGRRASRRRFLAWSESASQEDLVEFADRIAVA
jgi:hypothetical protein